MGEMMFAPQCHDQWMGGLGKKRPHPHIMSVADETQVETRKAMRAAMLKARFADTIFKATVELQTGSGNSCDVSSLQQIKAAQAASRRKAQYDLKKRREAEREAARMALQKVEKSVCVDEDAASIMRDFEKLIGLPSGTGLGYPNTKPPERRQRAEDDVEEGEIVS